MNDLADVSQAARVAVNAPVKKRSVRAPAVVLAGLAGALGIAALVRARRRARGEASTPRDKRAGGQGRGLIASGMSMLTLVPALSGRKRSGGKVVQALRLASAAAGLIRVARQPRSPRRSESRALSSSEGGAVLAAGRMLRGSAGLLAFAVLSDSALEHYRGSFRNPAMFAPLVSSSLSILANAQRMADGRGRAVRDGVHALAGTIGIAGLGFHLYNIGKRPGGYGWLNFFYAAPFAAPAALSLAGLIGFSAERLDVLKAAGEQRLLGLPFGRAAAGLVSVGLIGTVAEVGLLHFRGAFHNPFMWLPVSLPPVAAVLMAKAALLPGVGGQWLSRGWLWTTALLGIGGVGFHAYGVSRNMGGWRNWSQNLLVGPPLPAPPSFSALALAGIASLNLIDAAREQAR